MSDIFLWLIIIYIVIAILQRLFMTIMFIYVEGWEGALVAFILNVWDLTKIAFFILIFILFAKNCY